MSDILRMLLVDDNPNDWSLVRRELSQGFPDLVMEVITEVESFTQALEAGDFDLVMTDSQLSWSDGLAILREVKARWPGCPVIMLTASDSDEILVESLKAGLDDYVVKSANHLVGLPIMINGALRRAELSHHLRALKTRYQQLVDRLPLGLCRSTVEGEWVEINPAALRLLGLTSLEQATAQRLPEYYADPADYERWQQQVLEQGQVTNARVRLRRTDGSIIWVDLHATLVRDERDQPRFMDIILEDLTERQQAEVTLSRWQEQTRQLEAQLLQAQKLESLGTLVGGIAHDFNNMLTGILGFTQLLLHDVEPGGKVYEGLQRIELFSEHAANMVKQLLAFSRQEVGQKRALSLHSFLKEIRKLLERMIPENIEIELELASENFTVEADPTQLQQVLMNLAVNARDAMPEGGWFSIGTARVELDEAFCQAHLDIHPGSYVRVSVSDTGVGIPPEIHSRIFDPFFTTKETGKGTGLGLSVVYGIVKNHGGTIEVKSRAGGGTTFHIYWPLVEKAVEVVAPAPAQVRGGRETVLLVEDEPTVLELGRTALEHFGYRVLTASDGLEGVAVYQRHREEIALVILDVVMPKLGGRETLRELKRIMPDVRVLLATGYGSSGASVGGLLQEGVCGLVRKPFQIRELAQAVRTALDQYPVNELRSA
jgi:PAS domain S-box-containing protein